MSVETAFDKSVSYYDNWMKIAIPGHDKIFSTALELIPHKKYEAFDVLDLGAGTGLFSEFVINKYSRAEFLLVDLAPKMLSLARERFRDHKERFEYIVGDYRDCKDKNKFDLVISSLSIHHLIDIDKEKLFRQIFLSLKDSGVFINVDQIKGATPAIQKMYWESWLRMVREKGAAEEQIQESIQRRKEYDQDASLEDQLRWLTEAGFIDVDCVYKNSFVGVFFAQKTIAFA